MKFDCGESWSEKYDRLSEWHRFFSILPRRVGSHDCRFFEFIERKGTRYGCSTFRPFWNWEYRAVPPGQVPPVRNPTPGAIMDVIANAQQSRP